MSVASEYGCKELERFLFLFMLFCVIFKYIADCLGSIRIIVFLCAVIDCFTLFRIHQYDVIVQIHDDSHGQLTTFSKVN